MRLEATPVGRELAAVASRIVKELPRGELCAIVLWIKVKAVLWRLM
jgi:hypothetical protein